MARGKKAGEYNTKTTSYRGIVVFDVDGVIFKDIFLKKIVQAKGIVKYFKIVLLGMKYYREKISLENLLREGYRLAGNFSVEEAQIVADEIKRTTNIIPTIQTLHQNGYFVSLISAGIPGFVLDKLAKEVGADHYWGLEVEKNGEGISVKAIGELSKVDVVERLIDNLGLEWDRVFSVGDDPGNIDLLKKSKIGIGFNPVKSVRKNSDIVIEGNNFLEILPYIIPKDKLPREISIRRFNWKREIFRKGIHLGSSAVAFLARFNKTATVYALGGIISIFLLSELFRNFGLSLALFSHITRRAQRHSERKGIIFGPILLGIGIALTIAFFPSEIYIPAVLVVAISDSLSALVGWRFGRIHIFYMKNRTVEGSAAFFFSSLLILLIYFPLPTAILTTVLATFIELIPVFNLDNLLIPVGTALFLWLCGV